METSIVVRLIDETRQGLNQIQSNLRSIDDGVSSVSRSFQAMGAALAGAISAATLKSVYDLTDTIQTLDNRLRLVTNSTNELNAVYDKLFKVATDSRSTLDATATLYSKLAINQEAAGLSGRNLFSVVEAFNKTLVISGASATEAASATYQFAQAMQSGKLQGDEFRAMAEANPRFLKLISEQTGIATGELKRLASEGFLNAKIIGLALEQGLGDLNAQFAKMPMTVGQAMGQLTNEFQKLFREFMNGTGAGEAFVSVINHITRNIDNFAAVAKILGAALAAALIVFAPMTSAAIALGAAVVYLIEPIGKVAKALINLSEDVMNGAIKKFSQFGAAMKAVMNLENPFEAYKKAGEEFEKQLSDNAKALADNQKKTAALGTTVDNLTQSTKNGTQVTDAMRKAMQENGLAAKLNENSYLKLTESLKVQIEAAKLDEEQRRKQIFVFKELEKVQEDFRKQGKQLSEAQVTQMKQEIGTLYDQLIAAEETTKKRKQVTDDFYNFIKNNQTKSLSDYQIYERNIQLAFEARALNQKITEDDLQKYLDANRAQYSAKYVSMIQAQNLANLTNTQKYLKEIEQLEDDIRNNRLSKDLNEAEIRTAIAKKYNEEYVRLAKEGQENVLSSTQNYLNKVAEIENAAKIGIITSEIDKQNAILGARKQYGQEWDRMAQQSRDSNQTAEQIYLDRMLKFNEAYNAGLIKNEADAAAIRRKINEDYANATAREYSNLYGLLNEKIVQLTGMTSKEVGIMKDVFKLFGVDTDKILKDLFAQAILYVKGWLTGGSADITSLGQVMQSVFGPGGSSTNIVGTFVSTALDMFKGFGSGVTAIFGSFGTTIAGAFSAIGGFLKSNVLDVLVSIGSRALDAISSIGRLSGMTGGGGSTIGNLLSAGLNFVTGGVSGLVSSAVSFIGKLFSDRNLKTNVSPIGSMGGLGVYNYNYKSGYGLPGGMQTGFMSDEVQRMFPGAVGTRGGFDTVDYGRVMSGLANRTSMTSGPEMYMSGGGGGGVNINFTVNAVDAKDMDRLLVEKRQFITNMVRSAIAETGRSII